MVPAGKKWVCSAGYSFPAYDYIRRVFLLRPYPILVGKGWSKGEIPSKTSSEYVLRAFLLSFAPNSATIAFPS